MVDTLIGTVPEGPAAPPPPARRRPARWQVVTLAGVAAVSLAVGAAAVLPTADYRIAPGAANPVSELVTAEGVELFPPEGEVLYTTVRIGPLSWLERWMEERDPAVDIVPKEVILGDRSREETREENLRVMGASKDTATYVALHRLGFDVGITGGGVLVLEVGAEVPAAAVLARGDLITAVDGVAVQVPDQLRGELLDNQPGDTVVLTVVRDGTTSDVAVTLAAADDGRAIVGIAPGSPDTVQFQFPVDVTIDSGRTGGPSAGLAFTLTLLDELTPGELTGGGTVAVTGAIDLQGNVLPVGGVRQKAVAARKAGAALFLVPSGEVDTARAGAGDMAVVGVDTLDDALAELGRRGGDVSVVPPPAA